MLNSIASNNHITNNNTNEKNPSQGANVISNRANIKNNSVDRLVHLLSNSEKYLPMVSLPDTENYWSEGWKAHIVLNNINNKDIYTNICNTSNTEELVISSSSLTSPLSTNTSSATSSSSSSPSSQSKSNTINNAKIMHSTIVSNDFESEEENFFRNSFIDKEHLVFYGLDSNDQPFVLSYKFDSFDYSEYIRAILRLVLYFYKLIKELFLSDARNQN